MYVRQNKTKKSQNSLSTLKIFFLIQHKGKIFGVEFNFINLTKK